MESLSLWTGITLLKGLTVTLMTQETCLLRCTAACTREMPLLETVFKAACLQRRDFTCWRVLSTREVSAIPMTQGTCSIQSMVAFGSRLSYQGKAVQDTYHDIYRNICNISKLTKSTDISAWAEQGWWGEYVVFTGIRYSTVLIRWPATAWFKYCKHKLSTPPTLPSSSWEICTVSYKYLTTKQ